jgi:hypothetical protein
MRSNGGKWHDKNPSLSTECGALQGGGRAVRLPRRARAAHQDGLHVPVAGRQRIRHGAAGATGHRVVRGPSLALAAHAAVVAAAIYPVVGNRRSSPTAQVHQPRRSILTADAAGGLSGRGARPKNIAGQVGPGGSRGPIAFLRRTGTRFGADLLMKHAPPIGRARRPAAAPTAMAAADRRSSIDSADRGKRCCPDRPGGSWAAAPTFRM